MQERHFAAPNPAEPAEDDVYTTRKRLTDTAIMLAFSPFDWKLDARREDDIYALDVGPIRLSLRWPWAAP